MRAILAAWLLTLTGCRCSPGLTQVEPARVVAEPPRLSLPPTWVGRQSAGPVVFTNQGGATATFALSIEPPFSVSPSELTLSRGQSGSVQVSFAPSAAGPASAILRTGELDVQVDAEGLEVPVCVAAGACLSASFDFEAAQCRETWKPEGETCETSCVTGGCAQGVCLGQLKGCDDGDACTVDGCSETSGCSHAPRTCPVPANPCQVARCDAAAGCGTEDVADGTLCGRDDCKDTEIDVCITGQCVRRVRPATGRCANRWVPVSIPARAAFAMAYDEARQRLILFGGAPRTLGDTWEWDGQTWTLRMPANSPPARSHHAMAYDARRQRIVLFGGVDEVGTPFGDTWEWDGVNWVQRAPLLSPSPRADHAVVYDVARQKIVLFGGTRPGGYAGDTWEWDGAQWLLRSPAVSPSARYLHELAYDTSRQRVVLFGGYDTAVRFDTWEWDGTTWSQRASAGGPAGGVYHALAYDAARQRVVCFSGTDETGTTYGGTWEWDGTRWALVQGIRSPSARGQHAMAYDSVRRRVVMFGGFETGGNRGDGLSDTWEWDGQTWTRRAIVRSPSLRTYEAMTYDAARQRVVLHGGTGSGGDTASDTWEWDGTSWTERVLTSVPGSRLQHTLSWDAARHRVVLFGGLDGIGCCAPPYSDTWEWDGGGWTERTPMSAPSGRGGHVMVYDSARQRTVLFGGAEPNGTLFSETWEWDGTSWAERSSASGPPGRVGQAMAYDGARQNAVLFGGDGSAATWTWDGTAWLERMPANSPPPRAQHAMAYDSTRQRVVLFGGFQMPALYSDTWEWDGSDWLRRTPVISPPPSYGHALAYDAARQRMVLFQGADTWLFLP